MAHFHSSAAICRRLPQLVKLSKGSFLGLHFAFFRDHGAVVWDVAAVYVMEGAGSQNSVIAWRTTAPLPELPAAFQTNWLKIVYGLRVLADGTQPQQAMQRKLVLLQKSFKQLEQ